MSHYYLDELTKSNDQPSDNAVLEVKELLSEPIKQLEDINAEIKRLEEKRVELEKYINRYSRILAPIRRVPPDILCTIFEHCLPTHRNPTMAATEAPMLLTRICSSWRSIAMSFSSLWAQIHIPFLDEIEGRGRQRGDPVVSLEKIVDVLQLRCRAAQEWLSRSNDRPLSISISWHVQYFDLEMDSGTDQKDKTTIPILNILLMFSSRWRTLEFKFPVSVYHELESRLSAHTLPMLAHLRADIYQSMFESTISQVSSPPTMLLRAPNLKRVSIVMPNLTDWLRPADVTQLVPWNNVTHLSIFPPCTLGDCITLLKRYPLLVHGNFSIQHNFLLNGDGISIHEKIHLSDLLELRTSVANSSFLVPTLYNLIDAPKLRCIGYYNNLVSYEQGVSAATDEIPVYFIQRSTNLKKLEMDRFCLLPSNILNIFEAASQNVLTHLSLTSKYRLVALGTEQDPFDLETLIIDNILDTAPSQLLPHLEVFELHLTKVSDHIVVRFVTSRMNTMSHIAVLRKVRIIFARVKEEGGLDIVDEIRSRAEMAGIQMDISVQYAPTSLQVEKSRNFLSPSFIEPYKNDRTWSYEEPEE
ncbi:hypothetical protein CVT25_006815 [Psilocybe cyanescens]|uniref:F-box domain-containing protein n=1 Tax=Psilocybe cyanescens TaxID=93625 RepID=A0A409X7D1_PSICY|nr:hypothetical protein CVT25_006815 [Psilocybe cyanescens]